MHASISNEISLGLEMSRNIFFVCVFSEALLITVKSFDRFMYSYRSMIIAHVTSSSFHKKLMSAQAGDDHGLQTELVLSLED